MREEMFLGATGLSCESRNDPNKWERFVRLYYETRESLQQFVFLFLHTDLITFSTRTFMWKTMISDRYKVCANNIFTIIDGECFSGLLRKIPHGFSAWDNV